MTNYLPYIFGLTSLFGGVYMFLLSFRFYKPKHKNQEEKKRYEDWLKKFGKFMKICSVVLILNGSYILIKGNSNMFRIVNENSDWTLEERTYFIQECMREMNATKDYPQITEDYCTCSADQIIKTMTRSQYFELNNTKTQEEQINVLTPILQECANEYKQRIDSVNNIF